MLTADLRKRRAAGFELEVNLAVGAGETLVLAGESGSGKSTVLRLLAGLEPPDAGHIEVAGVPWFDDASRVCRAPQDRQVGWVPQDYALFPHLSVLENVAFGLRARGRPTGEVRRLAHEVMRRFELTDLQARRPAQLSGGQQQRVALARALVLDPKLLLLDEPLAALDLQSRQLLRAELRRLLADFPGVTVFVTHQPVEAMVFGDQVAVLEQGRVVQAGPPGELLQRPRSGYVAHFMGLNLLSGRVIERRPDGVVVIATADGTVTVASAEAAQASEVFVAVSPRDITLYRSAPETSAQNLYQGRILELVPEPPFGERVRVVLGTHPRLVAEVTLGAVRNLGLREGEEVYASFKATGAVAYS